MLGFKDYNYEHFTSDRFQEVTQAPFAGPKAGEQAPDFTTRDVNGEVVRLSDYHGKKNVLLVFGSTTCPMSAGSITGINELYDRLRGDDIEFLFIYVREAHPGEKISAHRSMEHKRSAARIFRDEEDLQMPVVVDDLHGSIHRKYSRLPNPAFLVDKSGRVAFRCMWANREELGNAIEELLEYQRERGIDHAIVGGGQDLSMPLSYGALFSYRALERGGEQSLKEFREVFGNSGRVTPAESRESKPLIEGPGRVLAVAALTAVVLAVGLYAGFELRKRRLGLRRNPYRAYEDAEVRDTETGTEYGAVGI
jgi:peroxiredoxin